MKTHYLSIPAAIIAGLSILGAVAPDHNGYKETDLVVNKEVQNVPTLVDANGITHIATNFDPNLVNPWGISESASSPFWISDNGAGLSTLYNSLGVPQMLKVSIPAPGDPLGASSTPTGTVFNIASGAGAFMISGVDTSGNPISKPAVFLFVTEDGTIVGWNPAVNPAGFAAGKAGTYGIIAVTTPDAVYKGLEIATDDSGATHLYATNFHAGAVDEFDAAWAPVHVSGAFSDPVIAPGYAPFNVAAITVDNVKRLIVTYAVQDADKHDDVAGQGHGIVMSYLPDGTFPRHFVLHGQLNSPWGMAVTPDSFGSEGGKLWIGNFGNGEINAYDLRHGEPAKKVVDASGKPIKIDGLWSLKFGNGGNGGAANTLYFTAGPNGEADGLFGSLTPIAH